MDRPKMLSGDELVTRGVTKINVSLPEVGMKDVLPNGSWLEKKQIQAALEARKHVVEVERIEKSGAISHATWCDDLNLAEVTQQVGGYWQYLGHSVGKKLYLRPEEALFLMESNCLILRHNGVVMSLQKAYSLLLKESIGIKQYKVYASLSRLGYKVFRHTKLNNKDISDKMVISNQSEDISSIETVELNEGSPDKEYGTLNTTNIENIDLGNNSILSRDTVDYDAQQLLATNSSTEMSNDFINQEKDNVQINNNNIEIDVTETVNIDASQQEEDVNSIKETQNMETLITGKNTNDKCINYRTMLLTLQNRQLTPCSSDNLHQYFNKIPNFVNKTVVTIDVPNEQYIPRNVFVNQTKYDLDLNLIKSKSRRCFSNENAYSADEVNESHVRRINSSSQNINPQINQNANVNQNFVQFRPFNIWRSQITQNNAFNVVFHRFPSNLYQPQLATQNTVFIRPFPNSNFGGFLPNRSISAPCVRYNRPIAQAQHLQSIKTLAARTRQLAASRRMQPTHVQGLRGLLDLYNATYRSRLRLTQEFEIIENEDVIETIEIDSDEPASKKSRLESNMFEENLNGIRDLALKLKMIEMKNGTKSKYRRALSNVIKKFNKSYNAEIYINEQYEIINKRHVTVDSSSDSDCVITETRKDMKRKKLKNPFSVSKKRVSTDANVTSQDAPQLIENKPGKDISSIEKVFNNNWLPNVDDFGRPEVVSKSFMSSRLINVTRDKYLYDFINNGSTIFDNWLEVKIAYLKYLEESDQIFQEQQKFIHECNVSDDTGLKPLLRPEDCSDMRKVLERLRIISTNKDYRGGKYEIDFDVYNRDVKKFKKTNPPQPHFRIVCVDESGSFPDALDVAALNIKYSDNIPILFAIVGMASISYVQVNCIDLPVYVPRSDIM